MVARFDTAIAEGNYPQQAQVVAIMTELDKEKSIAKVKGGDSTQPCAAQGHALLVLPLWWQCRCLSTTRN